MVALGFSIILAVSFEFARVFNAWDYRHFLRQLLGRYWIIYEALFALLLIIILAVTGSAAGAALAGTLGVPPLVGLSTLFVCIVVLNFFGREIVKNTLALGAGALCVGLIAYVILIALNPDAVMLSRFTRNISSLAGG